MALLVWFITGVAIWHFSVFVPDRFWGGIVGAFVGAVCGSLMLGAAVHIGAGRSLGETDISTALVAGAGSIVGMAAIYVLGARRERTSAG